MFVEAGKEQNILEKMNELGIKKANLIYSIKEINKITKEYKKKLQEEHNMEINFILEVKEQKNTKNKQFDGFLQLGTSKEKLILGTNYLYNNEFEEEKDYIHQRRSGLNHVVFKELETKNITVLTSYADLQNLSKKKRARTLGRIQQNMKLSKKYDVEYKIVCLGRETLQLRNPSDVKALQEFSQ